MGDWDGDGTDTPGLYRQSDGFVYLRNSNTQGSVASIPLFTRRITGSSKGTDRHGSSLEIQLPPGHPGFTAVGVPASIHRFAALHSYDNVPDARLPPELRDRNPNGVMERNVDLRWTTNDVA